MKLKNKQAYNLIVLVSFLEYKYQPHHFSKTETCFNIFNNVDQIILNNGYNLHHILIINESLYLPVVTLSFFHFLCLHLQLLETTK